MSIEQKVTIISGASGGLGQPVSRLFYESGARLVLVGSRPQSVQPLADQFDAARVLAVGADLTTAAGAEHVVEAALDKFGRVDILLNLAGGFAGGTPVADSDPQELEKMLAMNLYTAYFMCRAAVKPMIEQQWGRIINVGSRDSLKGRANYSAYSISKAGVLRLTESLAAELKKHNITVNAVLPGTIDTDANRQAMPQADTANWVNPTTIGQGLLFLAAENSATTGAAIPMFDQFA